MTRSVFVINCGSSSVKYSLIAPERGGEPLATGIAERVGTGHGRLAHRSGGTTTTTELPLPDHVAALRAVRDAMEDGGLAGPDGGLAAVAHRVVHGGSRFAAPVVVDDAVLAAIEDLSALAPLHNPANARGIEVARRAYPGVPHVAVFDTAFHQTLPPHASAYAVPAAWATSFGVRRYGFHGTSHAYVSRQAARHLGLAPERANQIVLHLGNGASATAVAGGRSVETSMGLTPLEGLVMGTRSGDVDPALIAHLQRTAGMSAAEVDEALNRHSGMQGLAGTNDLREVEARAAAGDEAATLALDVYCHRLRKYVGAFYAVLGRVDAVVFTAGVGENSAVVRARALEGLERLGIEVDPERNALRSREPREVSTDASEVKVLVVPTDEELEMATQALALVGGLGSPT